MLGVLLLLLLLGNFSLVKVVVKPSLRLFIRFCHYHSYCSLSSIQKVKVVATIDYNCPLRKENFESHYQPLLSR
jgi:hypothetical protein